MPSSGPRSTDTFTERGRRARQPALPHGDPARGLGDAERGDVAVSRATRDGTTSPDRRAGRTSRGAGGARAHGARRSGGRHAGPAAHRRQHARRHRGDRRALRRPHHHDRDRDRRAGPELGRGVRGRPPPGGLHLHRPRGAPRGRRRADDRPRQQRDGARRRRARRPAGPRAQPGAVARRAARRRGAAAADRGVDRHPHRERRRHRAAVPSHRRRHDHRRPPRARAGARRAVAVPLGPPVPAGVEVPRPAARHAPAPGRQPPGRLLAPAGDGHRRPRGASRRSARSSTGR